LTHHNQTNELTTWFLNICTQDDYHPGKANVVADALNRKKCCNSTFVRMMQPELRREIEYLNPGLVNESKVRMEVEPTLEAEI
jgi:hypothetical protein